MKTNQSLIGGRLIDEPRIYAAYARYFVKFVQAYERAGVPVYAVTVQNEPQNRKPDGYPGMDMPVAQQAKLIEALGPGAAAGRGCARRSSATTTTGPMHRERHRLDAAGRGSRDRVPDEAARRAAPRAGSPAPRSTATAATRAARPSCSARSPTRASGSPSARARTARTTRRRRSSPTRSSGTRATSCSASPATGARRSSTGTSRSTPRAARTTAAATPAPASSPSGPGRP